VAEAKEKKKNPSRRKVTEVQGCGGGHVLKPYDREGTLSRISTHS